jgi:hypothetical protein
MSNDKPKETGKYDVALGGQSQPSISPNAPAGLIDAKSRYNNGDLAEKKKAVTEALQYGYEGVKWLFKILDLQDSLEIEFFIYSLLEDSCKEDENPPKRPGVNWKNLLFWLNKQDDEPAKQPQVDRFRKNKQFKQQIKIKLKKYNFWYNLFQCKSCGALALGAGGKYNLFHSESKGRCRHEDFILVSEKRALSVSGMSEKKLLDRLHTILNSPDLKKSSNPPNPLLEEIEQRLGLRKQRLGTEKPVTERLPRFKEQYTKDIDEAVVLLCDKALPAVPIITKSKVESEYVKLKDSWRSRDFKEGTPQEIGDTLRNNLDRDAGLPGFSNFSVTVIPAQYCAQVNSYFETEAGVVHTNTYRIWHTESSVYFCGGKLAIL